MEEKLVHSKFRGSLLGSLLGDCLGAPYEGDEISSGDKIIIQRYFDKMEDSEFKAPFKKYTDDTAMMKSVARCLIDKPELDSKYMAKLFVTEFFKEPRRGYGQNVVDVFKKLRNTKYENVFKPAQQQFNGSGSYGNGGAMRIAPIALYFYDNFENTIRVATESTMITHSNILGINGAILQCLAVQQAFLIDPKVKIDVKDYCRNLYSKIEEIEKRTCDEEHSEIATAYQDKLKIVENLVNKEHSEHLDEEVIYTLGNGISAYESVPTAIYCFLRAQNEIPRIETNNIFRRTIQYAITFGGDTDTIACMAGAIAGAHLGEESINTHLAQHCENYEEIIQLADELFQTRKKFNTESKCKEKDNV